MELRGGERRRQRRPVGEGGRERLHRGTSGLVGKKLRSKLQNDHCDMNFGTEGVQIISMKPRFSVSIDASVFPSTTMRAPM